MTAKHPTFIVRNGEGSSYFFRSIIPRDLRRKHNYPKELRISLKTGIKSEAKRFAGAIKFQLDRIFSDIRCGSISETCVRSIKDELKTHIDGLLNHKYQSIGGYTDFDHFRPRPPTILKAYLLQEMKLQADFKLVRDYFGRFKHKDIIQFCEENDFEYSGDYYPKRHIRRSRENLIKMIDQEIGIDHFALDLAQEVTERYLSGLDFDKFIEFLSRFNIKAEKIGKSSLESGEVNVANLVQTMAESNDLIEIALELGVKNQLAVEEDDTEEESLKDDQVKESLKKVWDNVQSGDEESPRQEPEIAHVSPGSLAPTKELGPKLSAVIEEYIEEKINTKVWRGKSFLENRTALDKLIEIVGDKTTDHLSHEVARKFKRTLMKLPANMRKDARYRDKSIKEILNMKGVKPIAVNTLNNNISRVIAFMNWAKQHGYIVENFFEGLKVAKNKNIQDERKAFTIGDLKKIFDPETYMKKTMGLNFRYWIPLMAIFSGARLSELAQLHKVDIKKEQGIWCIDITETGDDPENPKKLKNMVSERMIPIHPQLIDLGSIDFVQEQKKDKNTVRLFPDLTFNKADYFSRRMGRWFNQFYLRKNLEINDPAKTFHSFRHTVADGLKQQGIAESFISELR